MHNILYAIVGFVFVLFVFAVALVRFSRNEHDEEDINGALEGDQVNFKDNHSIGHSSL